MISITKKFKREIGSLPNLSPQINPLTPEELLAIKSKILLAVNLGTIRPKAKTSIKHHFIYAWKWAISMLVGLSLIGSTALASANSKPGDLLYPIKKTSEKVRLKLAFSEQSKVNLEAEFAMERIDELQRLKNQNSQSAQNPGAPKNINSQIGPEKQEDATSSPNLDPDPNEQSQDRKEGESQKDEQIKKDAKIQAGKEVNKALRDLNKVKTKLETQGDGQGAEKINDNILKLKSQATQQGIHVESDKNGDDIEKLNINSEDAGSQNKAGKQKYRTGQSELYYPANPKPAVSGTTTKALPEPSPILEQKHLPVKKNNSQEYQKQNNSGENQEIKESEADFKP